MKFYTKIFLILFSLFLFPFVSFGATYGSNFITGGTVSCDSYTVGEICDYSVDGNVATDWSSANSAWPHYVKYDLGSGITKTAAKIYINIYAGAAGNYLKDFKLYASNDNTNWFVITTSSFSNASSSQWFTYTFTPSSTAYRYYKLQGDNNNNTSNTNLMVLNELNMMECLDCSASPTSTTPTSTTITTAEEYKNISIGNLAIQIFILIDFIFSCVVIVFIYKGTRKMLKI